MTSHGKTIQWLSFASIHPKCSVRIFLFIQVKKNRAGHIFFLWFQIIIRYLSEFKLHELQPNLEDFFIKINLTLPAVQARGQYKVNGKIIQIFPIYGEGDFEINVTRAAIAGSGKLDFVSDTLQMTTLSLNLSWEEMKVNMENLLGGGRFTKILQQIVPTIGKGVFDTFKPEVMREINKALKNELNKELRKPEVKDIIKGILPEM